MTAAEAGANPRTLCPHRDRRAQLHPALSVRPFIGILGVLLGSVISTIASRITVFGLADIRGAIHAGFDEGAWISTTFTVGQMMIGPLTVWLGGVFGPRRVLLTATVIYTAVSVALPYSPNLAVFLTLYAIAGLSSGTFIPITISFVLRNLPAQLAVYGISAYAMNSELSQNISASIEGWFTDHWSWKWIFWQSAFYTPLMLLCIWFGTPREPVNRSLLSRADWFGLLFASLGFSLLYAGLDQGNRLDWLNSGVVCGLLLSGGLLVAAFIIHELACEHPWIDIRFAIRGNIPILITVLTLFRFAVLSTSLIIPQYLTSVQDYRALEIGDILIWVAAPQFLLAPLIGKTLKHVDARIPLAVGFTLIGMACFMTGGLTMDWASGDFLPSQIVQAVGQSLCFTSIVWFFAKHLDPRDAFTFGAVVQTARLFGGELGIAFMQTFLRMREQIQSNLLGQHVTVGSALTDSRLGEYAAAVAARSIGPADAGARATGLLARAVQIQADVLSYIDGFTAIGFATIVGLVLIALLRAAPQAAAPSMDR